MQDNNVEATGPNSGKPPKPKFLNKSQRNEGHRSMAQIVFEGKQIITARPENMDKDEYRLLRKIQTETIKRLFFKGHSPSRKLRGIMGGKEPLARTQKGLRRIVKQRRAN